VHDAETVGDVVFAELGVLLGEVKTLGGVLAGLTGLEADVLDQADVSVGERGGQLLGGGTHDILGKLDVEVHELAQTLGDRGQGELGVDLALGASQVSQHGDAGASLVKLGQGGQSGLDAAVVGDLVAVERHVEIATDDDTLAAQVTQIVNRLHDSPFRSDWWKVVCGGPAGPHRFT
jgi:hypothetical protein